jgi:hypothetical protein
MKDRRLTAVKALLENGEITEIAQIFDLVPKSPTYKQLGMGYLRFLDCLKNSGNFTIDELITLADLVGVEGKVIVDLVYKSAAKQRRRRKQ